MNARPLAGALVFAGLALLVPAPARGDGAAELERLKDAIAESRERVAAWEREERSLLEAVEALDRSVELLAEQAERARQEAGEARTALEAVEAEAEGLAERLAATRRSMGARARALYRAGELGAVRLLFSAGGLREFLARVSGLRMLLAHDAELLDRYRAESAALVAARTRAREASRRRDEAVALLRVRSDELAHERAAKQRVVRRLHSDRARERAALIELETAARALEETLANLDGAQPAGAARPAGPPFAQLRGALRPPVEAEIVGDFGRVVDSEFRTETFRKGIEYAARRGTPVRAVASGRVRFAGWFRGYGKLVILDHGDRYYSVSGHLDEMQVEVGDAVAAGDPIGRVGDTGSLSGPRLYFEIRRGGEPLDPRDWLASRRAR